MAITREEDRKLANEVVDLIMERTDSEAPPAGANERQVRLGRFMAALAWFTHEMNELSKASFPMAREDEWDMAAVPWIQFLGGILFSQENPEAVSDLLAMTEDDSLLRRVAGMTADSMAIVWEKVKTPPDLSTNQTAQLMDLLRSALKEGKDE